MSPFNRFPRIWRRSVATLMLAAAGGLAAAGEVLPTPSRPAMPASGPMLDVSNCRMPEYPPESVRANETGTVTLRFHVSADGQPSRGEVATSSGYARLDRAALEALERCRFKPALDSAGRAVAAAGGVDYVWKLDDIPDPWRGIVIDSSRFPETRDLMAVPRTGQSAADPDLQRRILGHLASAARTRSGCKSIEDISIDKTPPARRVGLSTVGPAPTSEVQELWTLQQCDATIVHNVTLRWFNDGQVTYHLAPLVVPQLTVLSAPAPTVVTEQQTRAEYERAVRVLGQEYRVRHILTQHLVEAQAALDRIRGGEAFEAVAREVSKDPGSSSQGGDMGWNVPANFVEAFSDAMVRLAPQGISASPVQTRFGWHVIEVMAFRKRQMPAYELVKDRIAEDLRKHGSAGSR